MRTATPISTCSRMSDCAPSATMESISTPRFIGPGCITSASGLAIGELLLVEAEIGEIFLRRGHERAVHALALQPQHHHDVGAGEALAHVARDFDAEALDAGGQQRRGRDHAHARAERVEQDDVGARDARMQDVAADRDGQAFDRGPCCGGW